MRDEFADLRRRVDECLKAIVVAIVWLTIVVIVCAAVPAFGQESDTAWEVEISSFTCVTDHRFLDGWETVTTAQISLDEAKAYLNRHDLEVWSLGSRVISVPASTTSIDISGIEKPSFKLTDRLTLERRTLIKSPYQLIASCQIMPPPDGAAWIWSDETMSFELRLVRHVDDIGEPIDLKMSWTYEVVEVDLD